VGKEDDTISRNSAFLTQSAKTSLVVGMAPNFSWISTWHTSIAPVLECCCRRAMPSANAGTSAFKICRASGFPPPPILCCKPISTSLDEIQSARPLIDQTVSLNRFTAASCISSESCVAHAFRRPVRWFMIPQNSMSEGVDMVLGMIRSFFVDWSLRRSLRSSGATTRLTFGSTTWLSRLQEARKLAARAWCERRYGCRICPR